MKAERISIAGIGKPTSWLKGIRVAVVGIALAASPVARAPAAQPSAPNTGDLPVVRSAILDTGIDVPWSRPVRIVDLFEGESIGVFDRNEFFRNFLNTYSYINVVSLWRRDSVRFLFTYSSRDCFSVGIFGDWSGDRCTFANYPREIVRLYLKVGGEVFSVDGRNSIFPIDPELASALKNAPEGNVSVRLVTESGATLDSEIGKETVGSWKTIY